MEITDMEATIKCLTGWTDEDIDGLLVQCDALLQDPTSSPVLLKFAEQSIVAAFTIRALRDWP